jgi:hypothetical protein
MMAAILLPLKIALIVSLIQIHWLFVILKKKNAQQTLS